MRNRPALLAGAILLFCCAAHADDIAVIPAPVSIPAGATRSFDFGTVPQQGTTVTLEISSRLDSKGLSGSNDLMTLRLNGHDIKAAKSRTAPRLVNKPLVSLVTPTLPAPWISDMGWRVVYAPDFEGALKQGFYTGDPYTLVLDVTDLTNPISDNHLEIGNTSKPGISKFTGTPGDLVIGKLVVHTRAGASPTMTGADTVVSITNTGQPAAGSAAYTGQLLPGGGFAIVAGGHRYAFSSAFSYPNAGYNHLPAADRPDASGQPSWRVETTATGAGGTVLARGPDYTVGRTVHFTPRKVEIADTITNAHADAPLGLSVRDEMDMGELKDPIVRLAGNPDPALAEYYSNGNPSVHVSDGQSAIGLLCEDDVFRNQARLYVGSRGGKATVAGLRTDMLYLPPGASYTLRWSVYPVAGPDYYDFINLVRQDWGANFTVQGAWTFYKPDVINKMPLQEIHDKFSRLGIKYAIVGGGWIDATKDPKHIGFGAAVFDDYWADYRARIKASAARIREALLGTRVLVYINTQRDTSRDNQEEFHDSARTGPDGKQLATDWDGEYSHTYDMVATLNDSFGKAMIGVVDRYIDEMGIDGIYWDEMEGDSYGAPELTYNMADGHSCLLDPEHHTIERQVGLTTLLGQGQRLTMIAHVQNKGGVVMGNTPVCTRALLATGAQRMMEIQHNDYFALENDLDTPLGYMSWQPDFGNLTRAIGLAMLPVGTNYDYQYDAPRHLFPFTPIELHNGYLLGRERIVTLHSGSYGWPGAYRYRLWRYDVTGKNLDPEPVWHDGRDRVPVEVPADGLVIMERGG